MPALSLRSSPASSTIGPPSPTHHTAILNHGGSGHMTWGQWPRDKPSASIIVVMASLRAIAGAVLPADWKATMMLRRSAPPECGSAVCQHALSAATNTHGPSACGKQRQRRRPIASVGQEGETGG